MSRLSHDLNLEMIGILAKEFDVQEVTARFAGGLKSGIDAGELAGEVFGAYGEALAKRTLELGEKYTDQTYENLKIVARRVKRVIFPHIPQRFIEIGYLATQPFETLTVQQNNHSAFIYRVPECAIYEALKEKCGDDAAKGLPCEKACLAFIAAIFSGLNIAASLEMDAALPADGFCRFTATNPYPE